MALRISRTIVAVALLFGLLGTASPAAAHEEEESTQAVVLVRQAIALMVNTPKDKMAIEDKINDALKSKQPGSVDLVLVRAAKAAFARGELHTARAMLEVAVGARPHMTGLNIHPVGHVSPPPTDTEAAMRMATGGEPGTNVAIDPLAARRTLDGGTWAALGAMAGLALLGAGLAFRFRPPVTLRSLKAARGGQPI